MYKSNRRQEKYIDLSARETRRYIEMDFAPAPTKYELNQRREKLKRQKEAYERRNSKFMSEEREWLLYGTPPIQVRRGRGNKR